MTMNFQLLKASVVTLLGDNAAGEFRVVGYQKQAISGVETLDNSRLVKVFYASGDYPKSGGSLNGPFSHDMTFGLEMTVSKACEGDLAALVNPSSTALQYQTALADLKTGEDLVDDALDELHELIFQILMDARNQDLGLEPVRVANRWVTGYQKSEPLSNGEVVTITGTMPLTARMPETVSGDTGTTGTTIDMGLDHDADTVVRSGVINVNPE